MNTATQTLTNTTTTQAAELFACNTCGEAKLAGGYTFRKQRGTSYRMPICKACRSNGAKANVVPDVMKSLRFGVEVEWASGATRQAVAQAIALRIGGVASTSYNACAVTMADGRQIGIVYDGSCPNGGEMVTPIFTWADMATLKEIVRAMRGAGCIIDDGCGIHVHVDGLLFETAAQIKNMMRIHNRYWPTLNRVINPRASRVQYAREIAESKIAAIEKCGTKAEIADVWYSGNNYGRDRKYNATRYHAINMHSLFFRGTVEFRHFDSTLHAGKVRSYVELCLAMAAKALTVTQVSSKREAYTAGAEAKFFRYLGVQGAEFKVMRHHLSNNALSACGQAAQGWT